MTVPFVDVTSPDYNQQSKFQILTEPLQQLPHKCVGCSRFGRSNDRDQLLQFVDFNAEVEFYGKIFICTNCVTEMANQLNFMHPENVMALVKAKSDLIDEVGQLLQDKEELTHALAGFRRVFGDPNLTVSPDVYSVESDERADVKPELSTEPDSESTGGEEGLTEPDDEQGLTDLSDDEDLADFL